MKRMVSLFLLFTVIPSAAFAASPLVIQTSSGCPTGVTTSEPNCPAGAPTGAICRRSGANVVFETTGNQITAIAKKSGSAGRLNCNPHGANYNCVVTGSSGDHVDYYVDLQGCTRLDPTIIIR